MNINELLSTLTLDEKLNLLLGNSNFTNYSLSNVTFTNFSVKKVSKLLDEKVNTMCNCFDVDLISDFILNKIKDVSSNTILDLDLNFSLDETVNNIFKEKMLTILSQNFFVLNRTDVYTKTYNKLKNIVYYANDNLSQFNGCRVVSDASSADEALIKINEGAMLVFLSDDHIRTQVIDKCREYLRYYNDYNRKEITQEAFKTYLDSLGRAIINPNKIDESLEKLFKFIQDFELVDKHIFYEQEQIFSIYNNLALYNHVLLKNLGTLPLSDNNKILTINFKERLEYLNVIYDVSNIPFNNPVQAVKEQVNHIINAVDTVVMKIDVVNDGISEDKMDVIRYFKEINKRVVVLLEGGKFDNLNPDLIDVIIYRAYKNAYSNRALSQLLTGEKPFNGYLTQKTMNYPCGFGLSLATIDGDSFDSNIKDVSAVLRNNSQYIGGKLVMLYINNICQDFKTAIVKPNEGEKVYLSLVNVINTTRENNISLRSNAYADLFTQKVEKNIEFNFNDNEIVADFVGHTITEKDDNSKRRGGFFYIIVGLFALIVGYFGRTYIIDNFLFSEPELVGNGLMLVALVTFVIMIIFFFKSRKRGNKKYSVDKVFKGYTSYDSNEIVEQLEPQIEEVDTVTTTDDTKKEITYDYNEESNNEVNRINFEELLSSFHIYLEKHNIDVNKNILFDLFSAMTMSRLIFLEGESDQSEVLIKALFNFFDNEYNVTNITNANEVINLYEDETEITSLTKTILAAQKNEDKIYMSLIMGLNKNNSELFKTNLLDINSKHNEYSINLGLNKEINLPKNLWYFVMSDSYYNLDLTKNSARVIVNDVNYDIYSLELSSKPIDIKYLNREINQTKENYYLAEEEYKKLDVFFAELEKYGEFKLSNKDLISIENFIACYKVFNNNDIEVIDRLILLRFVPLIKAICVEKDVKNELISTLNNLFGENILLRTIKSLNE